jgi:hypothetical protein
LAKSSADENGNEVASETVVSEAAPDRRRLIRRLLSLGVTTAIAGLLLGQLPGESGITQVQGNDGAYVTVGQNVFGTNPSYNASIVTLHYTQSVSGNGGIAAFEVDNDGPATAAIGAYQNDTSTDPVSADFAIIGEILTPGTKYSEIPENSTAAIYGHARSTACKLWTSAFLGVNECTGSNGVGVIGIHEGSGVGVFGGARSSGIGVLAQALVAGSTPLVARAYNPQTANIQEWQTSSGSKLSVVNASGNLGVQTSTPECFIHIGGGATADVFCGIGPHPNTIVGGVYTGPAMNYGYSGNSFGEGSGFFNVRPDPSAVAPNPSLRFMTVNVQRMIITALLSVNGTANNPSASWGTFSDRRWKNPDSIRRFELGLEWIRTLPSPMRFRYAEGNGVELDPGEEHVNFIAQDLQDGVHDNLVYTTRSKVRVSDKEPTTMYGVNVNDMHFATVNAIKELAEENEQLAKKNEELVEHNTLLQEEIRLLKSRMDTFEQTIKLAAS